MLKIAVCDDEKYMVEIIEKYILEYAENKGIEFQVIKFESGKMLAKSLIKFDLIFLDIQMSEADEGITAAKSIRLLDMDTPIVFVTSFSDFCMQAHKVHAFDFISKPLEYADIERVLDDFRRIGEKHRNVLIEFKTLSGTMIQPVNEIIYIMVTAKRRELYLYVSSQKEKFKIKGNLSEIYSRLDSNQFFIPHRSYIINLDFVVSNKNRDFVLMSNGDKIPLTRDNSEKYKVQMHKYISERGDLLK